MKIKTILLVGITFLLLVTGIVAVKGGFSKGLVTKAETFYSEGLDSPHSVDFDSQGNMYISDSVRLKKIDAKTGEMTEFAKFSARCMTAVIDDNDIVYACTSNILYRISKEGDVKEVARGFVNADGLVMAKNGDILVADSYKDIIYRVKISGEKTVFLGSDLDTLKPSTFYITGMEFNKDYSKLYVVRHSSSKVMEYKINSDGTCGEGKVTAKVGLSSGPDYLVIDENNNLYVTTYFQNKVYKITPEGDVTRLKLTGASLKNPTGIAFGNQSEDNSFIYVANYDNGKIIKIDVGAKELKKIK